MDLSDLVFNVKNFGAKGDGVSFDTKEIQAAIDQCESVGGGTVIVPPGMYLCGTIHLCDNLELRIMPGATLMASKDETQFDPPEKIKFPDAQGDECAIFNYALLAGNDLENLRIIGGGALDDERHHRKGPKPIALKNCSNITIRDILIYNSPNYAVSLGNCEIILISNVRIFNSNCDGIDLDCCQNAQIINCQIASRDDAIVLKGSLAYGNPIPSMNITISNCDLATSCVGFKIGSETNGDFRNIVFSNCVIHPLGIGRAPLSGIALESVDGGIMKGLTITNISMTGMKSPIFLRLGKRLRGNLPNTPGEISDIQISNITAVDSHFPIVLSGLSEKKAKRISLNNIHVEYNYTVSGNLETLNEISTNENRTPGTTDILKIPEMEQKYPDIRMFGDPLPVWGIFARHLSDLRFSNVQLYLKTSDPRPPSMFLDIDRMGFDGVNYHSP
jgi:polygalacturonase